MARNADRPEAIMKQAVRNAVHHIVARYPEEPSLSHGFGGSIEWRVLADELYQQVQKAFAVSRLNLTEEQKKGIFLSVWKEQVTYELRRKASRRRTRTNDQKSVAEQPAEESSAGVRQVSIAASGTSRSDTHDDAVNAVKDPGMSDQAAPAGSSGFRALS